MLRTAAIGLGLLTGAGCASTWDAVSSRRFKADPFGSMFKPGDDPVAVLRAADPTQGEARARALERLTEPGGAAQDEVLQLVTDAATADPSPWVRLCAVDALGRFKDPRTADSLEAAYHRAGGTEPAAATKESAIQQVGVRDSAKTPPDRLAGLTAPRGFSPDQVAMIRSRAVDALAKTGDPKAVAFLARVAAGADFPESEDADGKDQVRRRAVAGLGTLRTPEAATALAKVMADEQGKDVALVSLAHTGLMDQTGKDLPADPAKWQEVVQAGGAR